MIKITSEIKKLIENNAMAMATCDKDGNPHCIAVGFCKVVSNSQIIITNNYMLETPKNIKLNPNISLTIWNQNWKKKCKGYELKGNAQYFTTGIWYQKIRKIKENRKEPCKGAILVTINKIKKLT